MNGFLDTLERELIGAVERHAHATESRAAEPIAGHAVKRSATATANWFAGRVSTPLRAAALAIALALGVAAAALAATGVIFSGTPVAPAPHLVPRAGVGMPARGSTRLFDRTVPDPAGGLPWAMRIVHTTRGEVCLQAGRLHDGQVGVIGEDGAFHDDGLFHRLPAARISASPGPSRFAVSCLPEGMTSEQELRGVSESGELPVGGRLGRLSAERFVDFGVLGPDAVSITYREDGRLRTVPVEPKTGAYLLVLPETKPGPKRSSQSTESGGSYGEVARMDGRIGAVAPIVSIRYRLGSTTCNEAKLGTSAAHPCPRESTAEVIARGKREANPPNLHAPVEVTLKPVRHLTYRTKSGKRREPGAIEGIYYDATISFKAPFAVVGANAGYTLEIHEPRCDAHGRGSGDVIAEGVPGLTARGALARDYARGATVRLTEANVFANDKCDKPERLEVDYYKLGSGGGRIVGEEIVPVP